MSTDVKIVQVICPGLKLPVRNEPNPNSKIRKFLLTEEVVRVYVKTQSGFYKLADDSVSHINQLIDKHKFLPSICL